MPTNFLKVGDFLHNNILIKDLSVAFNSSACIENYETFKNIDFGNKPFKHIIINNFLKLNSYKKLARFVKSRKFHLAQSDLYSFQQDFKFLKKNTLIENDLTLALFYFTPDMLACHDDVKDTRKIAFIFYIVPEDWSIVDGGIYFNYHKY
ncbi:hypothetical protein HZS_3438 [Henneguya salminicola]|nr:hypothetical protein HZS_3438 [Henneguya salminicola]